MLKMEILVDVDRDDLTTEEREKIEKFASELISEFEDKCNQHNLEIYDTNWDWE